MAAVAEFLNSTTAIFIAIVFLGLGLILVIKRGGVIKGPGGWSIEAPGPQTKILREKEGSRVFVEASLALSVAERIGSYKAEIAGLKPAAVARAMDYAQTKIDSLLYDVEEELGKLLDRNDEEQQALRGAGAAVVKSIRFKLIRDVLNPSFVNNGFFEYRAEENGKILNSRDWEDFITERQQTLRGYIKHSLRNNFNYMAVLEGPLKSIESGALSKRINEATEDIYGRFWEIQRQQKSTEAKLRAHVKELTDTIREGIG